MKITLTKSIEKTLTASFYGNANLNEGAIYNAKRSGFQKGFFTITLPNGNAIDIHEKNCKITA